MLFRAHHIGFTVTFFSGAIATVVSTIVASSPLWGLLPLLGWVFPSLLIFTALDQRKLKKLHHQLNEACQVSVWLQTFNALLPMRHVRRSPQLHSTVLLNLAAGYLEHGEPQAALNCLRQIPLPLPPAKGVVNIQHQIAYHTNHAAAFMAFGWWEYAEQALNNAKNLLDNAKLPPELYETAYRTYSLGLTFMQIRRGDVTVHDAEVMLQTLLTGACPTVNRVEIHDMLSDIYLTTGDATKARDSLDYVLAHGGDTIYVAHAHEKRAKIR